MLIILLLIPCVHLCRLAEHDMLVEQVPLEFRGLIPHEPEPIFKYSSEEDNSKC